MTASKEEVEALTLVLQTHLPEQGHRETYCSCGAPTGDYNTGFLEHKARAILDALPTPTSQDNSELLARAKKNLDSVRASQPKGVVPQDERLQLILELSSALEAAQPTKTTRVKFIADYEKLKSLLPMKVENIDGESASKWLEQHSVNETALAHVLHHTQEHIFDTECYHGTYSGGASNGEEFATCEILARAVLRTYTVTEKGKH